METMRVNWSPLAYSLTALGMCVLCVYMLLTDPGMHYKWLVIILAVFFGIFGVLAGIASVRVNRHRSRSPNARATTGGLTLSTKWMDKGKENVYPAAAEEAEKAKPRKRSRPTEGVLTYQMYRKK